MSDDLHTRLHTAITTRLEAAKAVAKPSDAIPVSVWEEGFGKIRRGLEAEIARHCEADLARLSEHEPCTDCWSDRKHDPICHRCANFAPCREERRLATVYLENTQT